MLKFKYGDGVIKKDKQTTRERILDAAEELFAHKGYEGVSIRQIMAKAEADVSLAYYHFKSKRDLFNEIMLRRVEILNDIRLKALEAVEERHPGNAPSVEEIIDAFTHPLLDLLAREHEEWKYYFQLIAHINNSPDWGGELMTRYFDPLVRRFLEALKKALPDCDDADLYWSYHFLSGALTLTFAETGRLDNLSGGAAKSSDMASVVDRMPKFLAAGFERLCKK
ncbi:MAG: TetR family transcriptional regulator [Woeseiaceae bacterium]|nr:TetR family transcriptional regulator [Woeseiaceae bacterium]